jgi:hypothetical protein
VSDKGDSRATSQKAGVQGQEKQDESFFIQQDFRQA